MRHRNELNCAMLQFLDLSSIQDTVFRHLSIQRHSNFVKSGRRKRRDGKSDANEFTWDKDHGEGSGLG
jgi:hypothetical protein